MPEKYWDPDKPSPIKAPTLSGIGDGVIEEMKGIPELVAFGLELATDREAATQVWESMKAMTPAKVGTMLLGAAEEKLAKYAQGGDVMKHEAGKDGVQIAMIALGSVKKVADNAKRIVEMADVVEDFVDIAADARKLVDDAVDLRAGRNLAKESKEAITDGITIDKNALDMSDLASKKGRKLTWEEVKALLKRGNDFNKTVRNLVPNPYQYYEVTVLKTLPDGSIKRYRLDSYNPGSEIVSRKATTFDEISTTTFQGYLSELTNKYAEGLKIVKPGTPIDGLTLSGTYKLEVPALNRNSSKLEEFTKLASDKGIEIIFKNE